MNRAALAQWRVSFEAETPRRLTVTAPPVTRQVTASYELREEEEPASIVGLSLSAQMVRLLGHPEGYGLAFPVRRALYQWDRYCRAHHGRWPDHRGRAVCSELAYAVIRDQCSLRWAAEQTDTSYLRAERLLIAAVERMIVWQTRWLTAGVDSRATA